MGLGIFTLSALRTYQLAIIACIAAFMQGYDSGAAGGVLTLPPFLRDFHYTVASQPHVNLLSVGLLQLGAFICSFFIFPFADWIGRKRAIQLAACIFIVGVILETVDSHSLTVWYVGRFIAGFGEGGCGVVTPILVAEMAEKSKRGKVGSCYQWMYTIGILVANWTNYGVFTGISSTDTAQWQVPIGLQLASGSFLLLGLFTLPESARWLLKKNRPEDAWKALCWIRASPTTGDSVKRTTTRAEFNDMVRGIEEENAARAGLTWKEIFSRANRKRFALGSALFAFQPCTGAPALAYFSPQFFALVVGSGAQDLFVVGWFGVIKVVATTLFVTVIAERFRRTRLLAFGAAAMASTMLSTALVYKFYPPATTKDGSPPPIGSAQIATIALIFLSIVFYNWSWGSLPWVMAPELFPTRTRAIGVAISMMSHWLWNFVFSISTPPMLVSLTGFGTFLLYAALNSLMVVFVFVFLKETRDKSLEQIQKEIEHDYNDSDSNIEEGKVSPVSSGVEAEEEKSMTHRAVGITEKIE